MLAQKTTMMVQLHSFLISLSFILASIVLLNVPKSACLFMQALRQLRQIAQEASQSSANWSQRPVALRALSQRLNRFVNLTFVTTGVHFVLFNSLI